MSKKLFHWGIFTSEGYLLFGGTWSKERCETKMKKLPRNARKVLKIQKYMVVRVD